MKRMLSCAPSLWLSLLLLLCLYPTPSASQQCGQCNAQSSIDFNVDLTFIKDGEDSFIEYTDSVYGDLRVEVPRFFFDYNKERIIREFHHSFQNSVWSQRVVLEIFYYAVTYGTDHMPENYTIDAANKMGLEPAENWMIDCVDICQWEGIVCGPLEDDDPIGKSVSDYKPQCHHVTSLDLMDKNLSGTLPSQLAHLKHLHRINLNDNKLHGEIPFEYGNFEHISFIDFGENQLTGRIPESLEKLAPTLQELWLEKNQLEGPLDYSLMQLTNCRFLDLSENKLTGTLPPEIGHLTSLSSLFLEENKLTGTLVPELGLLTSLRVIDIGVNDFTGPIPPEIGLCTSLIDFNVASNRLSKSIPVEIFYLTNLEVLMLSENELTGPLPEGDDPVPGRTTDLHTDDDKEDPKYNYAWEDFTELVALGVDRNNLSGTLPPQLVWGLAPSLTSLSIGFNFLEGTLPPEIGKMTKLQKFLSPFNFFVGTVPSEMERMTELWLLNLTSNFFTGTIPRSLCSDPILDEYMSVEFGCDALMCRPGTFQPSGAASIVGGCQPCPKTLLAEEFEPPLSTVLGRSSCESARYLVGDQNVDGKLSPREVLRYIYYELNGAVWGDKFKPWRDMKVNKCDLHGITCTNEKVTKIDLSEANLCTDGNTSAEINNGGVCPGLPGEIRYLNETLEEFHAKSRPYFRGAIPSEMGLLTKLRVLNLSGCPLLTGSIPSEIGLLRNLQLFDLSNGNFNGTIPASVGGMTSLEKINLSLNPLTGTLPSEIGLLPRLKEMRISRTDLNGTLPATLGNMKSLENMDMYGNSFSGSIPHELGESKALKKIDIFNNKFSGRIPPSLSNVKTLQILHLKKNHLSGEIPSSLGELPFLVWLDASLNMLSGTIPPSFATAPMLKDIRVHGNRLYEPIPPSLCSNPKMNGGNTVKYGCDAIVCPLGTFSHSNRGYAQDSSKCEKCPDGQTTMYLGSTECLELDQKDLLSMMFDVMDGDTWPEQYKKGWKDENTSICDWAGVTCNDKKEIIGLAIPRRERTFQETREGPPYQESNPG